MKIGPLEGRGLGHVAEFQFCDPLYVFGTVKGKTAYLVCISHRTTDYPYSWRGQVTRSDFYLRDAVSAVIATATWLAGWVAGWLSVTLQYCIKTAKPI